MKCILLAWSQGKTSSRASTYQMYIIINHSGWKYLRLDVMNKLNQNKIRGNDNFFFYLLGHWAFLQTNIGSKSSKFTGNSFHTLFAGDYAVVDFVYSFNYIGHWVGICWEIKKSIKWDICSYNFWTIVITFLEIS